MCFEVIFLFLLLFLTEENIFNVTEVRGQLEPGVSKRVTKFGDSSYCSTSLSPSASPFDFLFSGTSAAAGLALHQNMAMSIEDEGQLLHYSFSFVKLNFLIGDKFTFTGKF